MKFIVFPIALFVASATTAQKLPPAHPVPLEVADTTATLAPINAIFAAIAAGDAAAMLTHVYPDGRVTATGMRAPGVGGIRSESWTAFARRVTPEAAFEERISDPAVEIDGDVAMVWARFVVRRRGKINNCGFDHFDLIRTDGAWKVMNLSFSSRLTDCGD